MWPKTNKTKPVFKERLLWAWCFAKWFTCWDINPCNNRTYQMSKQFSRGWVLGPEEPASKGCSRVGTTAAWLWVLHSLSLHQPEWEVQACLGDDKPLRAEQGEGFFPEHTSQLQLLLFFPFLSPCFPVHGCEYGHLKPFVKQTQGSNWLFEEGNQHNWTLCAESHFVPRI